MIFHTINPILFLSNVFQSTFFEIYDLLCLISGPASVIVGNLVQGNRLAAARGRDVGSLEDEMGGTGGMMMGGGGLNESSMGGAGRKYHFISEILRLRAHSTSDHLLFTLLNSKGTETQTLTCSQLHKKAERIARLLIEKVSISQGFLSLLPRCFSLCC